MICCEAFEDTRLSPIKNSELISENRVRIVLSTRWFVLFIVTIALLISRPTTVYAGNDLETFGDYAVVGAPVAAGLLSLLMKDYEGNVQLGASVGVGSVTTHALKNITDKKRPDYKIGDKKDAFPSGHTSVTWAAAAYVRTRYGCYEFTFDCMKFTVPFTAVAAVTAYSRIDADRHDFADVLGGVAVAEAVNWLMVDTFDPSMRVTPTFHNGFGLAFTKRF